MYNGDLSCLGGWHLSISLSEEMRKEPISQEKTGGTVPSKNSRNRITDVGKGLRPSQK
jgi:hypothetical protein